VVPVETIYNSKWEKVSVKFEEVEFDDDTVRAICVFLIKSYLGKCEKTGDRVAATV
jgi:hypothetical protein